MLHMGKILTLNDSLSCLRLDISGVSGAGTGPSHKLPTWYHDFDDTHEASQITQILEILPYRVQKHSAGYTTDQL